MDWTRAVRTFTKSSSFKLQEWTYETYSIVHMHLFWYLLHPTYLIEILKFRIIHHARSYPSRRINRLRLHVSMERIEETLSHKYKITKLFCGFHIRFSLGMNGALGYPTWQTMNRWGMVLLVNLLLVELLSVPKLQPGITYECDWVLGASRPEALWALDVLYCCAGLSNFRGSLINLQAFNVQRWAEPSPCTCTWCLVKVQPHLYINVSRCKSSPLPLALYSTPLMARLNNSVIRLPLTQHAVNIVQTEISNREHNWICSTQPAFWIRNIGDSRPIKRPS